MAGYLPSVEYGNVQHLFFHEDRPDKVASVTYTVRFETTGSFQSFITQLHGRFWGRWGTPMDSGVTSQGSVLYMGPTPSEIVATDDFVYTGSNVGAKPPPSVNLLLHKRSGFAGRKNRGRIYMPWVISETTVDEAGQLLPGTIANRTALANDWLEDLATDDMPMYIAHSEPSLGAPRRVTEFTVSPLVATQRRRIRG